MTLAEYRLLYFLMANQGRAFTRQELLPNVVGEGVYVIDRNIDVHVRNVRKKIEDHASCIVTVRGIVTDSKPSRAPQTKPSVGIAEAERNGG